MQLCGGEGMRTLDEALASLVKEHKITLEQALVKSSNPQHLKGFLLQRHALSGAKCALTRLILPGIRYQKVLNL